VEITTRAVPGETLLGPIAFIDPNFDETTRTTRARVVLSNPHPATRSGEQHALPHRVPAEGRVLVESPAVLAAPRSAVLDAGAGPVAYVALGDGRYEPRHLRLGRRGDAMVEVLDGLKEGEQVVTTGALLIDAQAQLAHGVGGTASPGPASVTRLQPAPGPLPSPSDLRELATLAIDASSALAADDFATYQKLFPRLQAVAGAHPSLPALEVGENLRAARLSFEPWSTAVADLLKPQRASLGVKIFQCPMTPVLGKGRWVQRSQPLKNPFFGSAMADCGAEVQ
jgi:Cu(I)/Ag(I) efflux system membrane fusion protein